MVRGMKKVSLFEKLSLFDDHWKPKVVGELNGQHVKLARIEGEFVWHSHEAEDEVDRRRPDSRARRRHAGDDDDPQRVWCVAPGDRGARAVAPAQAAARFGAPLGHRQ